MTTAKKGNVTIHIDSSEQHKDVADGQLLECPECKTPTEQGFGMAGGGFGVYDFCPNCGKVVSKIQIEE